MFERNNRNANTIGTPGTAAIAERPATGNHQVPEFIDPFFTKTSLKRSFSMIENEHFGLVFEKTGSINWGKELKKDASNSKNACHSLDASSSSDTSNNSNASNKHH